MILSPTNPQHLTVVKIDDYQHDLFHARRCLSLDFRKGNCPAPLITSDVRRYMFQGDRALATHFTDGYAVGARKGPADPVVDERGHGFVSGYCVSL
jgi:hypothetical protein